MSHVVYSYDHTHDFEKMYRDLETLAKIKEIASQVMKTIPSRHLKDCKEKKTVANESESSLCSPPDAEEYICTLHQLNKSALKHFKNMDKMKKLSEVDVKLDRLDLILSFYQHMDTKIINAILEKQQDKIEKIEKKIFEAQDDLEKNISIEEAEKLKKHIRKKRAKMSVLSLCNNELYRNKNSEELLRDNIIVAYDDITKLM